MGEIYKIDLLGNYTRKELEKCLEANRFVLGKALAFDSVYASITLERYQRMDYISICYVSICQSTPSASAIASAELQREKLFYESEFRWGFDYRGKTFYFKNEADVVIAKFLG